MFSLISSLRSCLVPRASPDAARWRRTEDRPRASRPRQNATDTFTRASWRVATSLCKVYGPWTSATPAPPPLKVSPCSHRTFIYSVCVCVSMMRFTGTFMSFLPRHHWWVTDTCVSFYLFVGIHMFSFAPRCHSIGQSPRSIHSHSSFWFVIGVTGVGQVNLIQFNYRHTTEVVSNSNPANPSSSEKQGSKRRKTPLYNYKLQIQQQKWSQVTSWDNIFQE